MGLSDDEQQILSDIEAHLRAEDPKLVRTVATATVSTHTRRRIRTATALFAVGFALLLAVVPLSNIWVGLAGFGVMLLSVVIGGEALKRLGAEGTDGDLGAQLKIGLARYLDQRRERRSNA